MRTVQAGLLALIAATMLANGGKAQSFSPTADPADVYDFEVDKKVSDQRQDSDEALQAVKTAGATAQEIQKVIAVTGVHFLVLNPDFAEAVASEAANHEAEMTDLRRAIQVNAIFYTAIQQEGIQPENIVAVVLSDTEGGLPSEKQVTIYVME